MRTPTAHEIEKREAERAAWDACARFLVPLVKGADPLKQMRDMIAERDRLLPSLAPLAERVVLSDGRTIHYAPHEVPDGYHWRDSGNSRAVGPTIASKTFASPSADLLRDIAADATACADAMDRYHARQEASQ